MVEVRQEPRVIVGPHGHCLAPGCEGGVVVTKHGHALRSGGPPYAIATAIRALKGPSDA